MPFTASLDFWTVPKTSNFSTKKLKLFKQAVLFMYVKVFNEMYVSHLKSLYCTLMLYTDSLQKHNTCTAKNTSETPLNGQESGKHRAGSKVHNAQ